MSAHDDAFLDSVAALALGVLDDGERDATLRHLETCAECKAEYAQLRPVANLVGLSATAGPAELDELTSRRMRAAARAAIEPAAAAPAAAPVTARPRSTLLAYVLAAAAIVIAALTSINSATLQSQHGVDSERIAELQKQLNAKERAAEYDRAALADIFARDSTHYPVKGGEVVRNGDKLYLAMWALPPLQRGHVYQAWILAPGAKAVAPSVTFVPNGKGFAILRVPVSAQNVGAVAVSVEPDGGSKTPTTQPTFVQKIG